jgi:hypothetical protein
MNANLKGVANGVAELDSGGKVPSSQLPSYVDDTIEGYLYNSKWYKESAHTTEITGETGKIYVDLSTNKTYRWSGSAFVEISASLALGETSSTAYRGDRGKTAYDHSQSTHARIDATKTEASSTNGNIKINGTETKVYTHPGSGTNPHGTTKSDVGLGNVGNFKAVSTVANQGLSNTEKSNARANIGAGTSSLQLGTTSSTAAKGDHNHDDRYYTEDEENQIIDALSEKIGNVGNTDLQSQLNAATQSISKNKTDITQLKTDVAQNKTDIAANAAGISALNTGLTTKMEFIGSISNKYSNLSELYTAGQTKELKMGTFQWNEALRPTDEDGYVFIGNWHVTAIRYDFKEVFRLNSNSTWTKVVDLQQIMTS